MSGGCTTLVMTDVKRGTCIPADRHTHHWRGESQDVGTTRKSKKRLGERWHAI
jgi:hypothetical protein